MKRKTAGTVIVGIGLGLAQFVPVDRSSPPVETEVSAPSAVRALLRRACYDCHSNETVWPWYGGIAPVSWLLARDVREGRKSLNFSLWNRYNEKHRLRKWKEIGEEVEKGEMPPLLYVAGHPAARLTAEDRAALNEWAKSGGSEAGQPAKK